jgi:hypothetical protein
VVYISSCSCEIKWVGQLLDRQVLEDLYVVVHHAGPILHLGIDVVGEVDVVQPLGVISEPLEIEVYFVSSREAVLEGLMVGHLRPCLPSSHLLEDLCQLAGSQAFTGHVYLLARIELGVVQGLQHKWTQVRDREEQNEAFVWWMGMLNTNDPLAWWWGVMAGNPRWFS